MREQLKKALGLLQPKSAASGATLLIYHRIDGSTSNELDLAPAAFARQIDLLAGHDVVSLDAALDRLDAGDTTPSVVLTFDDGFDDVYTNAWPLLRERALPFTIYLASAFMGRQMKWASSTSTGEPGHGLTWDQLREMVDSGLCTIGNHTHHHVRPEVLTAAELDACTAEIEAQLGVTPRHFTYPWGIGVPALRREMGERFRSASTGVLGRNQPGGDYLNLTRVPVRRSDPDAFFTAKLHGRLLPERIYGWVVQAAKKLGLSS
jgi:peptidoglycan/xylan/chitin deacetylase (PgdA/CDA1 family)